MCEKGKVSARATLEGKGRTFEATKEYGVVFAVEAWFEHDEHRVSCAGLRTNQRGQRNKVGQETPKRNHDEQRGQRVLDGLLAETKGNTSRHVNRPQVRSRCRQTPATRRLQLHASFPHRLSFRLSAMSTITLDLKYAQEIIDFWSQKYDDAKTQLEAAQVRNLFHLFPAWQFP